MLCHPNLLELLKNHHGVAEICLCCPLKCLQSEHTYREECTRPSQSLTAEATAHAPKTCPSINQKINQQLDHQQIIHYFLSLFLSHLAFHRCVVQWMNKLKLRVFQIPCTSKELHKGFFSIINFNYNKN